MTRSAAALTSLHRAVKQGKEPRLPPPQGLPPAQSFVWRQTVDALPVAWFSREQIPLLAQYCHHVVRSAQIEAALVGVDPVNDLATFDKLVKLAAGESAKIGAHARAMRLTQQSRLKADTAANQAGAAAAAARVKSDPDDLLA